MKTRPFFTALALLAAAGTFAACGGGRTRQAANRNSVEAIEAEGYAPFNEGGPNTQAAAAIEAQRSAIEKVAGLFISPALRAEKYDQVKQTLLRSPQLYVKRSKILAERREGAVYHVTARVYVYTDKVSAALKGMAVSEPAGPGASAALLMNEFIGSSPSSYGDARTAFTGFLSRKTVLKFISSPALENSKDENSFFEAARASGADLVFVGRAEGQPLAAAQGQQPGFSTARADAGVKIYEAGSRRLLLELNADSSALDTAEEGAYRKALASAGELLAQQTAAKTDVFVRTAAPLVLRVRGLAGISDAAKFKDAVEHMPVIRADFENYSDGEAIMTVYPSHPDAQEFASSLLRTESLPLALENVSRFEADFSVIR